MKVSTTRASHRSLRARWPLTYTVALTLSSLTLSCGDIAAPRVGFPYVLKTVNGAALPTTLFPQLPPDTSYAAVLAEEVVFTSDTLFLFSRWYARAHVQQDGSTVYNLTQCWHNYSFNYRLRGDTVVTGSASLVEPNPPYPPSIFLLRSDALIAPYDFQGASNEYRYTFGQTVTLKCG
jgi:hypothetical protein